MNKNMIAFAKVNLGIKPSKRELLNILQECKEKQKNNKANVKKEFVKFLPFLHCYREVMKRVNDDNIFRLWYLGNVKNPEYNLQVQKRICEIENTKGQGDIVYESLLREYIKMYDLMPEMEQVLRIDARYKKVKEVYFELRARI